MVESYFNSYVVAVGGSGITNVATSLPVSVAAPIASGFRILVGTELMQVTAGGTTLTWTVTRGIEGTTAAVHSVGDIINVVITSGGLDQLRTQFNGTGLVSAFPTSGIKNGDTYWSTDTGVMSRYDGSAWQTSFGMLPVTPPVLSSLTGSTSSGSITDTTQGLAISLNTNASALYFNTTTTSAPLTATVGISGMVSPQNFAEIGLYFKDTVSGKFGSFIIQHSTNLLWTLGKNNADTSFNSNYITTAATETGFPSPIWWFQVKDDNTNRMYRLSMNGMDWFQIFSVGRTDFLTANQYGFIVTTPTSYSASYRIVHFSITNP